MTLSLATLLPILYALGLGTAPVPTRTLEGLRPGQPGVCHTVFQGDEVEPMHFVVRGIMTNYLGPGRDLLLVRLTGEKPEFTGVVSGMSGSPCFVDDKLVGALSYSFASFAKEPIAGITPIADMLDILTLPSAALPWRIAATAATEAGGRRPWPSAEHMAIWGGLPGSPGAERPGRCAAAPPPGAPVAPGSSAALGTQQLRPIATPLAISGVGAAALQAWSPTLQGLGFVPQLAATAARTGAVASAVGDKGRRTERANAPARSTPFAAAAVPLVPGGAIAAVLVQGDVDVAATGTVTWVNEGRVLAFGHPFFGNGPVSFPMANASIVNTMASAQHSFKMARTGAVVGEVTQDRLSAIAGVMGQRARMVPVRGQVRHAGSTAPFAFEVVRDPQMTPTMLAMALTGALDGRVSAQGRGTARLTATLAMEGVPAVRHYQVATGQHSQHFLAHLANGAANAFNLLWNAPDDATPGDAQLHIDVELKDAPYAEAITNLRLGAGTARAGEEFDVAVELSRQDAPPATARFAFRVPKGWQGETIGLYAVGAAQAQRLVDTLVGPPTPKNRLQVAAWLQAQRAPDRVYLLAVRTLPNLRHGGTSCAFVPGSAGALLAYEGGHGFADKGVAMELSELRRGAVEGLAHARLVVAPAR